MRDRELTNQDDALLLPKRSLKLVAFRSEACFHGRKWMQSKLADLKIDLWLATENGEYNGATNGQVDDLHMQIERLQTDLIPSIFSPEEGDRKLLITAAGAQMAQLALCIVQIRPDMVGAEKHQLLLESINFLDTQPAKSEAAKILCSFLDKSGIVPEDTKEVLGSAISLLRTYW
jgi:hypothetical protein